MERIKIEDKELKEHLDSLFDDSREIFTLDEERIRLTAVSCTKMVNQMRANHNTGLLETYMLAQGYIAGALLSSEVKGHDRIQLNIECGGPVKGMNIEAWAVGAVRGYLVNNPIPLEKPLSSLDTSPIYGPGFLSITKILEGSKTPFTGQIMMEYGNLAKDLALWYKESQQTPSLFYFSIKFDRKGRVTGAGGIFIQALPGCPDGVLSSLEDKFDNIKNLGECLAEKQNIKGYIEKEFSSHNPKHLEHSPIGFSCPCSRKGFSEYIKALPENEKRDILNQNAPIELECFNCGTKYKFEKSEVEALFAML